MAGISVTDTFDSLLSTTVRNYRKTMEDNAFNAMAFMWYMMSKNRKKYMDGGTELVIPLLYGKNTTAKAYSAYEHLDVTPQEGHTVAIYPWKQLAVSISISRIEERKNSGESKILDLLQSKVEQAELSIQDMLTEQLLGFPDNAAGGAGTAPYGESDKEINSIWHYLRLDADAATTVGGIDPSTNSWWRNYTSWTKTGDLSFDWDDTNQWILDKTGGLLGHMAHAYNSASKGNSHPDLLLSNQEGFEAYESLLQSNQRFTDMKSGDAGFQNLKYKGATFMFDDGVPGTAATVDLPIAFLTTKYLWWVVDKETDFMTTPFMRPHNQDAKTAQILTYGNLVCSNRARQAVIELGDET